MTPKEIAKKILALAEGTKYSGVSYDVSSIQPLAQAYLQQEIRIRDLELQLALAEAEADRE